MKLPFKVVAGGKHDGVNVAIALIAAAAVEAANNTTSSSVSTGAAAVVSNMGAGVLGAAVAAGVALLL
ncbi:unnamed protein product [[Candida] boidinii]|uniref:Unnamed protein product n=1 Tax=Candida boidinii TaxID=5477 RepID=A0A9W6SWR0_CANBO|nr:unnamed protein product [[Candida] boidinii]